MRGPIRLVRAMWRYRGEVQAHGDAYQAELATVVHTTVHETIFGRLALSGYRFAMRILVAGVAAAALFTLVLAYALWQVTPWAATGALLPLVLVGLLVAWRLSWGAPLDWLDEHADPSRRVTLDQLPQRLRALALETRTIANVPARLADELDQLARDAERETG